MVDTTLKSSYTQGLEERNGIWYSSRTKPVSFPREGYDNCFILEECSLWFRHRNHCILQVVKDYCPEHSVFFDLGGGNGYVARALQEAGFDTYLVEAGVAGTLNARSRGQRNIICSSIEDIDIPNNTIPACGLFDVLEHIEHDRAMLESILGLLAQTGLLFLTVPAYRFLWSPEDVYSGHFRRYSLSSLVCLLKEAGYTVKFTSYLFSFLPAGILLLRTIPGWLRPGSLQKAPDTSSFRRYHSPRSKVIEKIWNAFCRFELVMLAKKKKIPFGSTCLVVAQKSS